MGRDMEQHAKWERENLWKYTIKLHKVNDADVIEKLNEQTNKRAYLIGLIRNDKKGD